MEEAEQAELESIGPIMPEAPASMNIRFASQLGYDYMLTVRSFQEQGAGLMLLGLIPAIETKLGELSCKPIYGKNGPAATATPSEPPQKLCEAHNVMMDKRSGKSGIFYSHSLGKGPDGKTQWCNGQPKS